MLQSVLVITMHKISFYISHKLITSTKETSYLFKIMVLVFLDD